MNQQGSWIPPSLSWVQTSNQYVSLLGAESQDLFLSRRWRCCELQFSGIFWDLTSRLMFSFLVLVPPEPGLRGQARRRHDNQPVGKTGTRLLSGGDAGFCTPPCRRWVWCSVLLLVPDERLKRFFSPTPSSGNGFSVSANKQDRRHANSWTGAKQNQRNWSGLSSTRFSLSNQLSPKLGSDTCRTRVGSQQLGWRFTFSWSYDLVLFSLWTLTF